ARSWESPTNQNRSRSKMKKRLTMLAVFVSLLSGCTVGPKYRRPIVQPPAAFRGSSDTAAASDPGSLADMKWFEVFKDDQLQELIRTALVNNYDLQRAVARIQAARANLGITRSDQFPNITVGADVTTLRNSGSGQFVLPGGGNRDRTFGTVLLNLLSFEVDIWGRRRRAKQAARPKPRAPAEESK